MGTRSLTVFLNKDGEEVAVMYRQFDGYPTGHGQDLLDWGKGRRVVDGFTARDEVERSFNGAGCMAADCVAHFKRGIGRHYLNPTGTPRARVSYVYTVWPKDVAVWLRVNACYGDNDGPLYEGPLDGFDPELAERGDAE